MNPVVVIGIGNAFRGDDGIGPAAAAAIRELLPDAEVLTLDGEPTRLIDAWAGRDLAIIIDAIRSGGPPGRLHRVEVGVDAYPDHVAHPSTHGGGLVAAVSLGAALGRNPARLIVHGIEPADIAAGPYLSAPVRAALPVLVERVTREVRAVCA